MTVELALDLAVAAAFTLLAYAWLVYPSHLGWRAWRRSIPVFEDAPSPCPRAAVLISAFNEETEIGPRIANLLTQNYPVDRLRILVGLDGCTDGTERAAREWEARDRRVSVIAYAVNRGKMAVLKDLATACRVENGLVFPDRGADVLTFTDANTAFRADALRRLVTPLADAAIGGVCGRLVFVTDRSPDRDAAPAENPASEGSYWSWETRLKTDESRLDSCLGANGAIYAIRRGLFPSELPDNTIIDDFAIGMKVREQGFRVLYWPEAVAYEVLPEESNEWGRRVRIGAGAYQALCLCRACLAPRFGRFAWCFWSHKVLRWFTPHLGCVAVAAAAARLAVAPRADEPGAVLAALIVGGTVIAGLVTVVPASGRVGRLIRHFTLMQLALLMGFFQFLRGDLKGAWARTPRNVE